MSSFKRGIGSAKLCVHCNSPNNSSNPQNKPVQLLDKTYTIEGSYVVQSNGNRKLVLDLDISW